MNKTGSLSLARINHLLRSRSPADLMNDLLALLRARWYLASANQMGGMVRLWGRAIVHNQGEMILGPGVRMVGTMTPVELVTGPEGRLEIGAGTFINYGTSIAARLSVTIGSSCSIGPYVNIIDNQFHCVEPDRRNQMPDSKPVLLEDNVWLGGRVMVLPGVTIGRDSVVGAGSVVTKSIPPRTLAAGVPARILKTI
jgi:acetyltransferase-like isoleucine patch superfamily enzyme